MVAAQSPDAGTGVQGRVVDRAVASIEGKVITLTQLEFETRVQLVNRGGTEAAFAPLDGEDLRQGLQLAIAQRLATLEADRFDAYPLEPGELERALAEFRARIGGEGRLQTFLERQEADLQDVGAIVRRGAYIAPGAVLMPSFVNIGARVGKNSMVDTWATVGSCAQVGENVHISGGAGIGGVLEPLQANPVIIGDGAFIGARAEVAEGVIVGEGAVLSMGVYLGASTKIIDRATGEIHIGNVPPYAVVVSGTLPGKPLPDGSPGPNLYCAVIVKTVDAQTRSKTGINELLRD
jgi:acetyltransferase-like isoleucine patch superfamily enzyme